MSAHVPQRLTWLCAGCGDDWPCRTRRRQLLAEYTGAPVSLGLLMASALVDAMADLPAEPAGELYERFLGWVRSRSGHP